jgi:hypothetical protein
LKIVDLLIVVGVRMCNCRVKNYLQIEQDQLRPVLKIAVRVMFIMVTMVVVVIVFIMIFIAIMGKGGGVKRRFQGFFTRIQIKLPDCSPPK